MNVVTAVDDVESERLKDFVAQLDCANEIALRSEEFVCRFKDESENSTNVKVGDNPRVIVNLSVWETPEALEKFVWNTIHKRVYAKRGKWFEALTQAHFVMWWVPADHKPDVDEALARLADLNANGSGERAFGWDALPNVTLWKGQRCA